LESDKTDNKMVTEEVVQLYDEFNDKYKKLLEDNNLGDSILCICKKRSD